MELFPFQERAASQIAQRFHTYTVDPLMVDRQTTVPFFQTLVSITGSGKTVVLADAVAQMEALLPRHPIILWLSKGRVVVWQTYANLASGKYADNLSGFVVKPLLEATPADIADENAPLLLIATVAKFARQDEGETDRRIFQIQLDLASDSLWTLLKKRRLQSGERRPLVVIYDEGHNLSDLQTNRLLELSPDALVSASATISVPQALDRVIRRLRTDRDWTDADFTTAVLSNDVVASGLVKQRVSLGGYVTPMETAVDGLLADMRDATEVAADVDDPFRPKAIYVCRTNAVDGVSIAEDTRRPFAERQARPILIWRHLVETAGVDPSSIAIYCQLKFSKEHPPPPAFNLFGAGDKDYDRFVAGAYQHIIFNLGLQEGWDDPFCAFAYIDKDMASARQITQVVGRVLRQPNARHYPDPILNTAHFYIRSDERGVFDEILRDVQAQLASEHPSITLTVRPENRRASQERERPSRSRAVPVTSIDSANAVAPVRRIVNTMMDFSDGGANTVGQGSRMQILQEIGTGASTAFEWVEVEHSNRITARSIFRRELQRLYAGGLRRAGGPINLVDIEDPKFDARIEINSPAAEHVRDTAGSVVTAFIEHSRIVQNDDDAPYSVGPIAIDPAGAATFSNALHARYSGLNRFELEIAKSLDRTQRVWCRNAEASGYFIPLLDRGSSATFWPDFLVWIDRRVVAIDTKGKHLLSEDSRRKLFEIEGTDGPARIVIRMISEGQWHVAPSGQLGKRGSSGYSVWRWTNGRLACVHCSDTRETVQTALAL